MKRNKYPLTTQTNKLFIVIRKNKKFSKELLTGYCEEYFSQYVYIEHLEDIDPITGSVEGPHYHILGYAKKIRARLCTHLMDIVKYFRFDNANGIEIDKFDNLALSIQYLIHKNNPEKTPHYFNDLVYKWDKEELSLLLQSECSDYVSFDMIYSLCLQSHNIIEVIKGLGIKQYHKYRNTIKDIYDELKRV